jgi:ferredoxin-NADP reductase
MAESPPEKLALQVVRVAAEAKDVMVVELGAAGGGSLPPFEPGSHISLHLPNGLVRQYSLLNDCREQHRYVLGVGLARESRGGSLHIHGSLREGATVQAEAPRNHFSLDPNAGKYCFIAGGIGITPILSMIRWCETHRKPWRLVYAARNRQRAAFYETLRQFDGDRIRFHFDDEHAEPLNVAQIVEAVQENEHIYCCGPESLMKAVQAAAAPPLAERLHFEWFTSAAVDAPGDDGGFWVDLKRSGKSIFVESTMSILEALEKNGHEVPFSCREGLCGTCETTVCDGEPDHRDFVFSDAERARRRSIILCVSRSKSDRLGLDL